MADPELSRGWEFLDEAGYSDYSKINGTPEEVLGSVTRLMDNSNLDSLDLDHDKMSRLFQGMRSNARGNTIGVKELADGLNDLADSGVEIKTLTHYSAI